MAVSSHVTIGVPVYRGELFIEEALRSIQRQTHREIDVVISLDGPDPVSEELCAPFLRDSRFRLVVQPKRLGWVGHINWLMGQATGGFGAYAPVSTMTGTERVSLLDGYIEYLRTTRSLDMPGLLGSDWKDIQDWTGGFYAATRLV